MRWHHFFVFLLSVCWRSASDRLLASVDSIFNDFLSGCLVSQSVEGKKNNHPYTDSVTKKEETQTENVDLMIPLTCSSIPVYHCVPSSVLLTALEGPKLSIWKLRFSPFLFLLEDSKFLYPWQFISSLHLVIHQVCRSALCHAEGCFYIALLKQVMISMAKGFTVSTIFVCSSKL